MYIAITAKQADYVTSCIRNLLCLLSFRQLVLEGEHMSNISMHFSVSSFYRCGGR